MAWSDKLPVDLGVLCGAVEAALRDIQQSLDFLGEYTIETTPGSVIYDLGDLGMMRFRKLGAGQTEWYANNPPNDRKPTAEEQKPVLAIVDDAERQRAMGELHGRIRSQMMGMYPLRCSRKKAIKERVLDDLKKDGLLADTETAQGNGEKAASVKLPGRGGRPRLEADRKEYIYRLAKAQEAEEFRARESDAEWDIIASKIGWLYGNRKRGVKMLEDARKRLAVASSSDLREVTEYRTKTKEENGREKR